MSADPAVSTEVAVAATVPEGSAALFSAVEDGDGDEDGLPVGDGDGLPVEVPVGEGDELPVGEGLALPDGDADGLAAGSDDDGVGEAAGSVVAEDDGAGEAVGLATVGVGDAAGLADVAAGVGDGELLGRQMMPRMQS